MSTEKSPQQDKCPQNGDTQLITKLRNPTQFRLAVDNQTNFAIQLSSD